jgi:hypothetical protein
MNETECSRSIYDWFQAVTLAGLTLEPFKILESFVEMVDAIRTKRTLLDKSRMDFLFRLRALCTHAFPPLHYCRWI